MSSTRFFLQASVAILLTGGGVFLGFLWSDGLATQTMAGIGFTIAVVGLVLGRRAFRARERAMREEWSGRGSGSGGA